MLQISWLCSRNSAWLTVSLLKILLGQMRAHPYVPVGPGCAVGRPNTSSHTPTGCPPLSSFNSYFLCWEDSKNKWISQYPLGTIWQSENMYFSTICWRLLTPDRLLLARERGSWGAPSSRRMFNGVSCIELLRIYRTYLPPGVGYCGVGIKASYCCCY